MKRLQALIAATMITILVGFGMLTIGVDAASNPNSVPVNSSPAQAAAVTTTNASNSTQAVSAQMQAQIDQMQNLIKQYQDREKQYQTEISNLSQQVSDATSQANQLQQILVELQQRGVIQVTRDGRIFIRGGD